MDELKKIDIIRNRFDVNYTEAREILTENNDDLVSALINLEEMGKCDSEEDVRKENQFRVKGQELINRIREIIREGNVNKIVVKNDNKVLLEIPVTAGVAGLVLFPYITVLGGLAALYKDYTLEIERPEKSMVETEV